MSDDETNLEPQLLAAAGEVGDGVADVFGVLLIPTNPDRVHSMKA